MFRLVALTIPVAIFPIIAVHAVEAVIARGVLPELADSLQSAALRDGVPGMQPDEVPRTNTIIHIDNLHSALPVKLRF